MGVVDDGGRRPLSEFTVVEIGDQVAVRYCGRLFAALGARVLRLERAMGDHRLGYAGAAGEAFGRWLDAGKSILEEVVDNCQLVIGGQGGADIRRAEAFAEGQAQRPVLLAVPWFDPHGPYAGWAGSDEIIAALNGVAYPFGPAEGPPMLPQGHAQEITAGVTAFNAALGALLAPPDERPARVEINVFEASLCFSETATLAAHAAGTQSLRLGVNRFVPTYPCSPYRTADGWVGVTCLTPPQWTALCQLIGRPELAEDPRFETSYFRLLLGDEVDQILAAAMPARTTDEWVRLAIRHRIPITPMVRPGELPAEPQWVARGDFAPIAPGDVLGPTLPYLITFDGSPQPRWPHTSGGGPLSGLRVADFTMGWAGPLCTRLLGDLGAEVIKVESRKHPDWWRGWEDTGDPADREIRHGFIAVNRNKLGVDLDLTTPDGLAHAKALIASADVVVDNYAAGVMEKLGLGPAVQRALRPGVISVSMAAFGRAGPLSPLRAYGSTVEQASGMPFVNGEPDWVPAQQHLAFGDPIAGLYAASAILVALTARERLGGADIDLSQVSALFQLGADAIIAEQVIGGEVPRTGVARARLPLCAVTRAAGDDQWLAVAPSDASALRRLAEIIGAEGAGALAQWAHDRDAAAAATLLQSAGVAAAPVTPADALVRDPQLVAAGAFREMDRAYVGRHLIVEAPFRFDGRRPKIARTAPVLGEHTAEVLAEIGSANG